jgi:hypothetical protein
MSNDKTIASLRKAAAAARLGHKAARRTSLHALQAALRHYAETFDEEPSAFAARVLLEIDSALPLTGPDPHGRGPTRETSRVLQRARADLCLLVGD